MAKTDSIVSAEERAARIRAESARIEKEEAEKEAQQKAHRAKQDDEGAKSNNAAIDRAIASLSEIETRDQLLDQIRVMREPVPEVEYRPQLTERMQQELSIEQAAGRAAVERALREQQYNKDVAAKVLLEEQQRGTMQPVTHPNPGMNEAFPVSGASFGKRK